MNRYSELTGLLRGLKLVAMADSVSDVALKAAGQPQPRGIPLRTAAAGAGAAHAAAGGAAAPRAGCRGRRPLRRWSLRASAAGSPAGGAAAAGEFVKQAVNVVAVGPPGVGKSHLLASVAHTLIAQGIPVLWSSTAQLMQRLLAAKRDLRLPQELARLDRYACLVLDDIGYVQHSRTRWRCYSPCSRSATSGGA